MTQSSSVSGEAPGLHRGRTLKVGLLFIWFFLSMSAFWLLKPLRVASLLSHLGAWQTPYLKIGSMVAAGLAVAVYSWVADRASRRALATGTSAFFALLFVVLAVAMRLGGESLRASMPFVYGFYVLTDIYSTVMVAVFWTYTNDVVTRQEADELYGPIGLGGILGGVAGGIGADTLAKPLGPTSLLLVCAALALGTSLVAATSEALLRPPPRRVGVESRGGSLTAIFEGVHEIRKSSYLLLLVGIVIAYEVASTMNDFALNVMFESTFHGGSQIAKMYGRLGWVVNGTALLTQLVLVPLVLPRKRLALLLVPVAMLTAALGTIAIPAIATIFVLSSADNGLAYSVQQSTKETLYVPLQDAQKYKAKACVDMFVQRAAKAVASVIIIALTATIGVSVRAPLTVSLASLAIWTVLATALAKRYYQHIRHEVPSSGTGGLSAKPEPDVLEPPEARPSLA